MDTLHTEKHLYYEQMNMPVPDFPVKLFPFTLHKRGASFPLHWHEHMEFLFITEGYGSIRCGNDTYSVMPGDTIFINSSELHSGENVSECLRYYCIIFDFQLLHSLSNDACQTKYVRAIADNRIRFHNLIRGDILLTQTVEELIREYEARQTGYELAIKSCLYRLIVQLLREHVDLSPLALSLRNEASIERISSALKYIESNYTEKLTVNKLANIMGVSRYYFCHIFKEVTGKTFSDYLNQYRIYKAEALLRNTNLNITEVALATGYQDINYFSRVFKSRHLCSPSSFRSLHKDEISPGH